jgi:hypothetical protein
MDINEMLVTGEGGDSIEIPEDASDENLNEVGKLDADAPLLREWSPITFQFFREEGTSKADLYDASTCASVLNESAEIFAAIDDLELLPIQAIDVPAYCPDADPFGYLLHFTNRVKLLDGSIVEYFPATNGISNIEKAVLPRSALRKRRVFQIEGNPVSIYCTSEFKKSFCERNMTGVVFEDLSGIFECAAE